MTDISMAQLKVYPNCPRPFGRKPRRLYPNPYAAMVGPGQPALPCGFCSGYSGLSVCVAGARQPGF